jgi:Rieske Fe-S protein
MPHPDPGERFPRSKFLEASTLGLGAVIGGIVTVPVAGFAVLPAYLNQKRHEVDLGPIDKIKEGQWYITSFTLDPAQGEVSRRTAFVRNNGTVVSGGKQVPSFTIISNRCAHLGCPVQPLGLVQAAQSKTIQSVNLEPVRTTPVLAVSGFSCPCHGGAYDTEGNRTAGPPVRALDRFAYSIVKGRLVLGTMYSVASVSGTGAEAEIHKHKLYGPGQHVDGWEQIFYPFTPPS